MKVNKIGFLSGLMLISCNLFADQDIAGTWRNIDDKTGFSKGLIEIYKNSDGSYSGKVVAITPHPGYTPKEICDRCPGEYRNKPIIGLTIINNFRQSKDRATDYTGGLILDPSSGKFYKSRLRLNSTGKRLNVRGFIGVEMIGRSQTWLRIE